MQLGKVSASNFCSYRTIEFDYADLGLALVSGPTKAGKSTVMDLAPWILYGVTSKDSLADDIKSWFADGPTAGELEVTLPDGKITIQRTRGNGKQNDLVWTEADGTVMRGKDINDTQKLLDKRLGVSAELFIDGSYIHQFSKADTFFVAKAKDRRDTLERIADLKLPILLAERTSAARKDAKAQLERAQLAQAKAEERADQSRTQLKIDAADSAKWDASQAERIARLKDLSNNFRVDKTNRQIAIAEKIEQLDKLIFDPAKYDLQTQEARRQLAALENVEIELRTVRQNLANIIAEINSGAKEYARLEKLDGRCPTCLGNADNASRSARMDEIERAVSDLVLSQDSAKSQVSRLEEALKAKPKLHDHVYNLQQKRIDNQRLMDSAAAERKALDMVRAEKDRFLAQAEELELQQNPFVARMQKCAQLAELDTHELEKVNRHVGELTNRVSSLTQLYNLSFELRGKLLEQAIAAIERRTNGILEQFFDAEIRVEFSLTDSDKLDVVIRNEGYECPYKQLSGGERCLLKLSFAIAYMKAAENMAGVKLTTLMLDEALNGLDAALKVRAFNLLQSLESEYTTVLCIDHSEELKQLFPNKFYVSKAGAYSQISQAEQT